MPIPSLGSDSTDAHRCSCKTTSDYTDATGTVPTQQNDTQPVEHIVCFCRFEGWPIEHCSASADRQKVPKTRTGSLKPSHKRIRTSCLRGR
jgi:hypothetical protein